MRFQSGTILTAILLALAASPALASPTGGGSPVRGWVTTPGPVAAPGPIAGAGLGFLVLAGGYYVVRRWRKQSPGE
jgi:hypothetical protein